MDNSTTTNETTTPPSTPPTKIRQGAPGAPVRSRRSRENPPDPIPLYLWGQGNNNEELN